MTEQQDNTNQQESANAATGWGNRWQIPLLMLSLALCGLAAWQYCVHRPKPTWDGRFQYIVNATSAVTDGNYREVDRLARELLADTQPDDRPARDKVHELTADAKPGEHPQHAKVNELLGDIRWRSIHASNDRSAEQWKAMLEYYQHAFDGGFEKTAEHCERSGDAYADLGDIAKAKEQYEAAWAMDASRAPKLKQAVIELRRATEKLSNADLLAALDDYLKTDGLTGEQYGWGFEQQLNLLIEDGQLAEALALIEKVLAGTAAPNYQDQLLYQKARVLGQTGKMEQADDLLIALTGRLRPSDELYAKANVLRGNLIWQDNDREAMQAFNNVVTYAPGTAPATAARAGLGKVYVKIGLTDKALQEYEHVLEDLTHQKPNPYIDIPALRAALGRVRDALVSQDQPEDALPFTKLERKALAAQRPAATAREKMDLLGRLAGAYLAAAEQAKARAAQLSPVSDEAEIAKLDEKYKEHLKGAAEAFLERAAIAAPLDDAIQGESLWMAADALDAAGLRPRAIAAFREFISGRPSDPRIPEARFRLGQALQALGLYQEAIDAYQANRELSGSGNRHMKVIQGLIPMARCYMALGESCYPQAEKTLLSIIDDEDIVTPESDLYRDALFALGRLHYLQKNWRAAIYRLGEAVQRDPGQPLGANQPDPRGQRQRYLLATHSMYLVAECYYHLALDTGAAAAREQNILRREELRRAKVDQLTQAALTYTQVIERLENLPGALSDLDQGYRRNSYFSRGDCVFELGRDDPDRLPEAIALYENAVFLFQKHPAALGGLMQIYNAQMAQNRLVDAQAANERARVLLDHMDPFVMQDPVLAVNLNTWKQWLGSLDKLNPLLTGKDQP